MLYLLSTEYDVSIQDLMYWLKYFDKKFTPIYLNQQISDFCLNLSNNEHVLELFTTDYFYQIDLNKDRFFYRKGSFGYFVNYKPDVFKSSFFEKFLNKEIATINQLVVKMFYNMSNIVTANQLNKLEVLKVASDFGLNIPNSIVVSHKKRLVEFFRRNNEKIVVKPIYEGINLNIKNGFFKSYTSRIQIEDINGYADTFHPTLFQNEIEKMIDIRTFYLKGRFFSMAIFSQDDNMSVVDFRNYNPNKKLVTTPFKLPDEIEFKLTKVFSEISIDTGSVDLCLTNDNEFIFLEINPVGQYSMLYNCNFHLDREIAKIL